MTRKLYRPRDENRERDIGASTLKSARTFLIADSLDDALAKLDTRRAVVRDQAINGLLPTGINDSWVRLSDVLAYLDSVERTLRDAAAREVKPQLPTWQGGPCIKSASWRINARIPEGGRALDGLLTETALMGTGLRVALMDAECRADAIAAREQELHEAEQKRLKTQKRKRQRRKARR